MDLQSPLWQSPAAGLLMAEDGLFVQAGGMLKCTGRGKSCLFLICAKPSEPTPHSMHLSQFPLCPARPLVVTVAGSQG